jgi:hypothetical protein
MVRLVTCICVLLAAGALYVLAVPTGPPEKLPAKSGQRTDVITVFLTGNELGALKPCGCSGEQLGGLDRRHAIFNGVQPSKRLIVDTGWLVEGDGEQDLIKFNIVIQAFSLLDYDLVNLSRGDIETARNVGLLESLDSVVNIISSQSGDDVNMPSKFTKKFFLKDKSVAVTVASFDVKSAPTKQIEELFATQSDLQTVKILILNDCKGDVFDYIVKSGLADFLVCPSESDEPSVIGRAASGSAPTSDPNERPLVVTVGRYGKYIGRLQIKAGQAEEKLTLSFSYIPVTEDLPQEKSLVELYKSYQQLVEQAGLLEKQPRFALPNGLEYTSSKSCKACHKYEYEKWSTKAHAHAYATLERVGSQYDPECVSCHVIGAEYESGFISEKKTAELKNVGCENCHGPGSEHILTQGKAETVEPRSNCTDCHTPENSGNYAGNEQLYFEKIVHWREPQAGSDVKKDNE